MTAAVPGAIAARSPALEARGIDKRFGPVHANRNISLVVRRGTIHGIIGENGAGKSTLMASSTDSISPTAARSGSTASRSASAAHRTRSRPEIGRAHV